MEDYLNLAQKLVSLKTEDGNQSAFEAAWYGIDEVLDSYKYKRFMDKGYESRMYFSNGKMPENFKVVLNGHLDVVPGDSNLYKPTIIGDRLYGRGAYDMKAALAVEILLFKELAEQLPYKLGLQIVTDEERGGFSGTEYQFKQGIKAEFGLAAESGSDYAIKHKAKGIYWCKVTFEGVSSHSSQPWLGDNALYHAQEFLAKLKKEFPVPKEEAWVTTVTPSNIDSNNPALNKIPDRVSIYMDVRYVPKDQKTVLDRVKKLLPPKASFEEILSGSALDTNENHPFIQKLQKACKENNIKTSLKKSHGTGDMRFYTSYGSAGIEFGPIGGNAHNHEEWVSLKSLEQYYQVLKVWLLSLG